MNTVISELLESHLEIIAKELEIPIFYENIEPIANSEIYLKSTILPALTTCLDLDEKSRIYNGEFQVSVVVPVNTGKLRSLQISDMIIKHFSPNLELTKDDFSLYLNSIPSICPAILDKTTYTVPISMNYCANLLI